jgi:hypothetical protein
VDANWRWEGCGKLLKAKGIRGARWTLAGIFGGRVTKSTLASKARQIWDGERGADFLIGRGGVVFLLKTGKMAGSRVSGLDGHSDALSNDDFKKGECS